MRRAVVVGGRGQCGRAIAAALVADGWAVTATTGGPAPAIAGVAWAPGEAGLAEVADGADVVVHTAAYDAGDAAALVDLGDRIGSAVVLSSVSVYTDGAGRSLDEASGEADFPQWPVPIPEAWPTLPAGPATYSTRKVAMEDELRAAAPWPATIVRPGAIHGVGSRHLREWWFVKRVLDGREAVVLPYGGRSTFAPTATANLAELVRLAAASPGDRTLNCGDLDPPTVSGISEAVDAVMGASTRRVAVEGPPPAPGVGEHPWCVPRPVVVDMARAVAELGYRQPVGYAEALGETVPWVLDACRGRDWRDVLPRLAAYPEDLFAYGAEDDWLARHG